MKYSEALAALNDADTSVETRDEAARLVAERIAEISDNDVTDAMITWLKTADLPRIEPGPPLYTPRPVLLAGLWEKHERSQRSR